MIAQAPESLAQTAPVIAGLGIAVAFVVSLICRWGDRT